MKKKYKLITVAASIGIVTASIAAPTYLIISNETTKKNSNESNNPLIPEENETPADTEYPYSYFFEWPAIRRLGEVNLFYCLLDIF